MKWIFNEMSKYYLHKKTTCKKARCLARYLHEDDIFPKKLTLDIVLQIHVIIYAIASAEELTCRLHVRRKSVLQKHLLSVSTNCILRVMIIGSWLARALGAYISRGSCLVQLVQAKPRARTKRSNTQEDITHLKRKMGLTCKQNTKVKEMFKLIEKLQVST